MKSKEEKAKLKQKVKLMRKRILISAIILAISLIATEITATTYNLFVHGRSGKSHCATLSSVSSGTSDVNNYWGGAASTKSNVRFVGFDGTKSGGAYSWSSCGAQYQMYAALNTFCTGANNCNIYAHSTGGLVVSYYLYNSGISGRNISTVRLLANASGGSELANFSTSYLAWLGFDTTGGELDASVSTSGARNWNHNSTAGLVLDLASGEASDYLGVTSGLLPGQDDGVLANHTLCGLNRINRDIDTSCPIGTGYINEPYACGFLYLSTCYDKYYRWTGYKTVYRNSSDTHGGSKKRH